MPSPAAVDISHSTEPATTVPSTGHLGRLATMESMPLLACLLTISATRPVTLATPPLITQSIVKLMEAQPLLASMDTILAVEPVYLAQPSPEQTATGSPARVQPLH